MRAILLTLFCFVGLGTAFYAPFVGVLMWHWLSIMNPHIFTYGFVGGLPIIAIVGAVAILMWLASAEPKRLPPYQATVLLIVFVFWTSITTMFAASPEQAVEKWIQFLKIVLMVFITITMTTTRMRIVALVWVVAVSIGFWSTKGGLWALATGGANTVLGPAGTFMADNNQFALAMLMALPLWLFLSEVVSYRAVRLGAIGVAGLTAVATVFTYSRGAALGLAIVSLFVWWSSRRRVLAAVIVGAILVAGIPFIPEKWFNRMDTISGAANAEEEAPKEPRLLIWQMGISMSKASPIIGYGFKGFLNQDVFLTHRPSGLDRAFEAHSIYFQVLGEHGYVGLAIFLGLGGSFLWSMYRIYRQTRGSPQQFWVHRLSRALFLSGLAFGISGAFLSQAYFDMYYLLVAIGISLQRIVRQGEAPPKVDNFPRLLEMLRINTVSYGLEAPKSPPSTGMSMPGAAPALTRG